MREEVEILVAGTRLEGAPMLPVCATSGAGVAELVAEIGRQLATIERPPPRGRFRLPVDRAFVLKGHGVVVTGTAVAGTIAPGAEVHVLPGGERARVRSVEIHGAPATVAGWRQRVALNLSGIERTEIVRGHVVSDPAITLVSERFDARVEIRPAARKGVASHARVRVHLGTAEVHGKIVLLEGGNVLEPRKSAYAQLVLDQPLVALRGDRFIVRAENASATLGGGEVVLPAAERHAKSEGALLARLEAIRAGEIDAAAIAVVELASDFGLSVGAIAERLNVDESEVTRALAGAPTLLVLSDGTGPDTWTTTDKWEQVGAAVSTMVAKFHDANPLLPGVEMEAVRAGLPRPIGAKLFRSVVDRLVAAGTITRADSLIAAPGHRVTLAGGQEDVATRIEAALVQAGYTPPDVRVLETELGVPRRRLTDLLGVLEKQGRVVRVTGDIYYAADAAGRARAALEQFLQNRPEITAAEFRDCLDVSRKYSIALLDYFDRTGVTLRVGDARRLRRA